MTGTTHIPTKMDIKKTDHKNTTGLKQDSTADVKVAENVWRLRKFQIHTVIATESGRKLVYKCATTEESQPFLKTIPEKEIFNLEYLRGQFDVLCGTLKGERIEYEYLAYPSLQDKIAEYLLHGNYQSANKLFESYVKRIYALPRTHLLPDEFLRTVAQDTSENKLKMDCLNRGLLDLTPRNIFVNGERWIALDNEWSFDFPVPVCFLIFRAVRELAIMLQSEIRLSANKENPVVSIFATNIATFYVPTAWVKYISDQDISLSRLLRWEYGFRKYVGGTTRSGRWNRIKLFHRTRTHFEDREIYVEKQYATRFVRLLKKLPGVRRLVNILDEKQLSWRK
ncbi:MAG: hypothetical protein ABSH16_02795 [Sedimentisphaerales bacterium]